MEITIDLKESNYELIQKIKTKYGFETDSDTINYIITTYGSLIK